MVVLLAFAVVPAHGLQVEPSHRQAVHVAGFGDRLWAALVHLLPRAWQKEGMSIDPDGKPTVNPDPQVQPDEGVTIDPNGLKK